MPIAPSELRGVRGGSRSGMRRALAATLLAATAFLAAACGPRARGAGRTGEPCGKDLDCAAGLCVAGVAGDAPVCTRTCAREGDCPHGWYCSGMTQRNVLVCSKAAPTPFGTGR